MKPNEKSELDTILELRCATSGEITRRCKGPCGQEKRLELFALKSGLTETKVRREAFCKPCKATLIREKRNAAKTHKSTLRPTAERTIEPEKLPSKPQKFIEAVVDQTSTIAANAKFNYSSELSFHEKYDAVLRFNEFINLLKEGLSEMTEKQIYVLKD